ncbi:hypothetical protein RI543_004525 [Arxiozyma heterogenica]|uniref:polynucleotide adenylyltransferase n=1 Tax=Arxiozyma heterogenica TaxID=278026 RepID=A0AAN8A6V0_9SACH|nr:hypothetical protein RI543_004525 [Kazachstania heterogenica]
MSKTSHIETNSIVNNPILIEEGELKEKEEIDREKEKDNNDGKGNNSFLDQDNFILIEDDNEEGFDDYDGHFDNPTETESKESSEVPNLSLPKHNSLEENDDFIAFSNSSLSSDSDELQDSKLENRLEESQLEKGKIETAITSSDYPWTINHDHSKETEIADWLTLEIHDFVKYISPSKEEIKARNITISKLRQAVKSLWPDADLHVFGSYATDLYLPGSDIDCVVNSEGGDKQTRTCLYKLAQHLKNEHIATEIEVIVKTRVPIIKFVEPETQIHIDVSFERTNGLEAAKLIREWLEETPGLRELVLIIKQFLHSRRLNNVHTGGLGGFSIICLVYSFLHLHPRILTGEIDPLENLGVLLIDFFELYGKNFGYDDVAISLLGGKPAYFSKLDWKELYPIRNSFSLAIQDPGDKTNNISRGSFNIRDIKKAFAGAFDLLTNRCFELDSIPFSKRKGQSILGNVIKYKGKQRDFKDERNLVLNKAIVENENYHQKKRSRIVHDMGDNELNSYENESKESSPDPPLKKRKKDKSNSDKKKDKKKSKVEKIKKKKNKVKDTKETELTTFIAAKDEDEDDYNPLSV